MFLDEALRIHRETGRKIRPKPQSYTPDDYDTAKYWLSDASGATILSLDWEVEPAKVEVTREQLKCAIRSVSQLNLRTGHYGDLDETINAICEKVGL